MSISKLGLLALFSITLFLGLIETSTASALAPGFGVVSKLPLEIETVTSTSVCGTSRTNGRMCLGTNSNEIMANDTVGKIQHFILGAGHLCGVDERGVRCWATQNRYEKPIQQILSSGDNKMVRFSSDKVCLPQPNKKIHCYGAEQGLWVESQAGSGNRDRYVRQIPPREEYGPYNDLRDFQLTGESICVLNGEQVSCLKFPAKWDNNRNEFNLPKQVYPGAKALSVGWETMCVLFQDGVDCARGSNETARTFKLRGAWTKATTLFPIGTDSICGTDASNQPLCAKLGSENDEVTENLPAEIKVPELEVLKFKADGDTKCALVRNTTNGEQSLMCGAYSAMTKTAIATDAVDFHVHREAICAKNEKGVISCFIHSSNLESPLPEDGSTAHSAGKCRWNNSRFHCSATETKTDFDDVRHVLGATRNSSDLPLPCVIFENRAGLRTVKCFGGNTTLEEQMPALDSENVHIEATYNYACVYGGPNTRCWGEPLGGSPAPNLGSVKRILFSRDFGCATDQFGFLCWGAQLEERNLLPPVGLRDFDSISDFALGAKHICAITRDNRVECWGDDSAGQLNVPPMTNPTSIAASENTTCASSDEGVTCWGFREDALLGNGEAKTRPTSVPQN